MKTFKSIEDYKKYINNFEDIFCSNEDFMIENGVTMVFSTSINEELPPNQIIFGEPALIGSNLCMLIRVLPENLVKYMLKALKKIK